MRKHTKHRVYGGVQHHFTFDNGRGASVVRHSFSYGRQTGTWELAVLGQDGKIDYSTPITGDVLGWLTPAAVRATLRAIEALP